MKQKYRYVACDPDVRKAAYAVVDEEGFLVDSWTIDATNIEHSAIMHATSHPKHIEEDAIYVLTVESQEYYKGDDPRLVKSLLQLARACGISMGYLSRMYPQHESLSLLLPKVWTKGRPKHVNQFWTIKNMGMTPVDSKSAKKYTYAKELLGKHSASQQKHIMDAIAMAVHAKTAHQKQLKLDRFKKESK